MDADPRVVPRHSAPSSSSTTTPTPTSSDHLTPHSQTHQQQNNSSNSYYHDDSPHSPHSATATGAAAALGSGTTTTTDAYNNNITNAHPDPLADLKRPRACEACRALKVRCDPDTSTNGSNGEGGSCRRCAKAGRRCVVTVPTRKRQKRADGRVAELERKIDALTASLMASKGRGTDGGGQLAIGSGLQQGASSTSLAGSKRYASGEYKARLGGTAGLAPLPARGRSPMTADGSMALEDDNGDLNNNNESESVQRPWPPFQPALDRGPKAHYDYEYTDVIDREIVDTETALKAFNRYVDEIAPQAPFVVFPPATTMAEVRRTKPVLFLAILSISVGVFQRDLPVILLNEVYRIYADQVIIKGTKSLELVQAIVVSTIWYAPPDHYEELKFFQLIHIAAAMGMDLGMNRRTKSKSKSMGMWREIMGKKAVMLDPDAPETRRAWLGCYFMSVNAAMSLRRPLLTRWQPYIDECLEILQTSPEKLPSDAVVIQWVKLAHIGEEILFQFSMDDPATNVDITDPKIQYALKGFERRLEEWRKEVPSECYSPTMHHYELVLNIYMHEIGMHADHNIDDFKPPFINGLNSETSVDLGTPAHVDALTTCLTSIHAAINTFASIDHSTLQCLPTIHYVRTAYASVALIKLFTATSHPSTRLGRVFNLTDFKIEDYLGKLIQHMKVPGESGGGRVAGRFALMLEMLKSWFVKRKEGKPITSGAAAAGGLTKFLQPKDIRSYMPPEPAGEEAKAKGGARQEVRGLSDNADSSPLHLLSQVAMDRPETHASTQSYSQNLQPRHQQSDQSIIQPSSNPQTASSLPLPPATPMTANPIPPTEPWSAYGPSILGMGVFPAATSNQFLPSSQYIPVTAAQAVSGPGHGQPQVFENDVQNSTEMEGFMLDPDLQLAFQQQEELAALGNMWDDIFFPFPMDGGGVGF
ncbi:hypothetical protein AJ79_05012 [Helicocarpus griseus UAMH5409]|uniref:Zn(2)-C6 fungal-type domain-containing protein n=1 Tax=Helicocarpus griseus UAMH5409 TaxID=1447875 RepID=A0A2B7XQC4_9EURO|nr:hypothetical protein AJ79_05012 [Helicocarpus griseus UAMH5409]